MNWTLYFRHCYMHYTVLYNKALGTLCVLKCYEPCNVLYLNALWTLWPPSMCLPFLLLFAPHCTLHNVQHCHALAVKTLWRVFCLLHNSCTSTGALHTTAHFLSTALHYTLHCAVFHLKVLDSVYTTLHYALLRGCFIYFSHYCNLYTLPSCSPGHAISKAVSWASVALFLPVVVNFELYNREFNGKRA